jgi:hypothetical protein
MSDFLLPDCPVCGRAMGRIDRSTKGKDTAKRTCPVCKRRFLFLIEWHSDRPHEFVAERIHDNQKRRRL